MSDLRPLSGFLDLNLPDKATGDVFPVSAYNAVLRTFEDKVNSIIQAAKDRESNYASGSTPTDNTVRGKIYASQPASGRVQLKVDPDGAGADDELLQASEAFRISLKTASTATAKLGGPIDVDTDDVTASGGADHVDMITGILPANTIQDDEDVVEMVGWGSGNNIAIALGFRWASTSFAVSNGINGAWIRKVVIPGTGSGSAKAVFVTHVANDNRSGSVDAGDAAVLDLSEDFSSEQSFAFTSDFNGETMTQNALIVRKN